MDPCFFLQLESDPVGRLERPISIPVNLSDLVLMRTTLSSHPCTLCQSAALSVSPALSPLQRVECLSFASDRFSQVECHTGCFKYSSVRGSIPLNKSRRASAFVPSHGFVMKGLMNVVQYDIMTRVVPNDSELNVSLASASSPVSPDIHRTLRRDVFPVPPSLLAFWCKR